ncbi:MAG TPA: hypothetical protein VKH34_00865 [Vicinamibacterales bacterium]|nr:MAG: hypothetical protein E6G26_01250 [Actinomycetota bacterium]HMC75641.1 hypothetical protein [Vicinamibacterales bacterium]
MRIAALAVLLAVVVAGCGSSAPPQITVGAARTYQLAGWSPAQVSAGKPTTVSFRIDQPSGAPLTNYRTGSGPHTGVHLIIVRSDLGTIIHHHPKPQPDGMFRQTVTFPTPGRYKVVVDAYPALSGPLRNFQLIRWITVPGKAPHDALPRFKPVVNVGGYRFALQGKPKLRAIQANFMSLRVTRPDGSPATFTPWFGALAHAIFFRAGTLDYFHTHVCSAKTSGCTSVFGGSRVVGTQTKPGVLRVGVLLPRSGTWRLFLQTKLDGRVLTAPFTLNVR